MFAFSDFDRDIWLRAFQALYQKIKKNLPQYDIDPNVYTKDRQIHTIGKQVETKASRALAGFTNDEYQNTKEDED